MLASLGPVDTLPLDAVAPASLPRRPELAGPASFAPEDPTPLEPVDPEALDPEDEAPLEPGDPEEPLEPEPPPLPDPAPDALPEDALPVSSAVIEASRESLLPLLPSTDDCCPPPEQAAHVNKPM